MDLESGSFVIWKFRDIFLRNVSQNLQNSALAPIAFDFCQSSPPESKKKPACYKIIIFAVAARLSY
jgi:hypothetical protein